MGSKLIITGVTGMVGEGVLLECLSDPAIDQVLSVSRKPYGLIHPKLKECIVADFMQLNGIEDELQGFDGCLFCAGISSNGMSEADYTHITYDITLNFAKTVLAKNPDMIFSYISGSMTDSSEKGKMMWARVKGRTENDLMRMPFRKVYCFRPGFMQPASNQKNVKGFYRFIGKLYPFLNLFFPNQISTMHQVGKAMINSILKDWDKQILEVKDINALSVN
jgi:uncharacterized protein YbjT (DUF2867 family)